MLAFDFKMTAAALFAISAMLPLTARAQQAANCPINHEQLVETLKHSVKASGGPDEGGMPVNEWAAVVNRLGDVCAVAFSGPKTTDQWLGSRAIAVEKANTVVSFSLDTFAISTANLWAQAQPGGSLYGANTSNPVVAAGDLCRQSVGIRQQRPIRSLASIRAA